MSKIKVNEIEAATGSTVTIPTGQTFSVADGIPATNLSGTIADARLPTVPVTKGGTGLTSLGSAGQAIKVNSGGNALEFGAVAGGKILQVVSGNHTTQASTTSTSFQDVSSNTNVSMTCSATSSKVLILAHFNELYYNGNTSLYLRVTAGGTEIMRVNNAVYTPSLGGEKLFNQDLIFLYSPSSTSAIEYKMQFHSQNSTAVRVNQNGVAGGSSIILMEVGA